jgi:holo-[acyl-carrier protein] synthase
MIYLGTDIVEVNRIEKLITSKGDAFLKHVYTYNEIEYCSQKQHPFIHYAGKFAGKEAVKKAILSSKIIDTIPLKQISILNNNIGAPFVKFENNTLSKFRIEISVSHTEQYATATAIIELNA